MVIAVPKLLSTPMHSIVQVQESPPLIGQGLLPKPNGGAVPELLHPPSGREPPLIGQGLLPKPMVVPYLKYLSSQWKKAHLSLVAVLLPEPLVIAVPELLHVYADALHVQ
jgi:hypothetical protein